MKTLKVLIVVALLALPFNCFCGENSSQEFVDKRNIAKIVVDPYLEFMLEKRCFVGEDSLSAF